MKSRDPHSDTNKDSLWTLRESAEGMDKFIEAHPLEVEKESLGRYIDASAIPLDNRKANPSKSDAECFSDCK